MKKTIKLILTIILILTFTGCVAEEITESTDEYTLKYKDINIVLNEEFNNIKPSLGKYKSYKEQPSCAFFGIDKIYKYEDIEIYTYPKDNKDYIYQIYLLNESIKTNEGLSLGSTFNEMKTVYGTNYKQNGNEYSYEKNQTSIDIIIENDFVTQISYSYKLK